MIPINALQTGLEEQDDDQSEFNEEELFKELLINPAVMNLFTLLGFFE